MKDQCIAVMRVQGLPTRWRARVEKLLVHIVKSQPFEALPGTDVYDLAACTRWRRSSSKKGCVDCREVINGTHDELEILSWELQQLAAELECEMMVEVVR